MGEALHLDFETRSTLDLKKTGLHKYADPKHTEVICMAYAFGEGPVEVWRLGQSIPEQVINHVKSRQEIFAHNASFEFELWNKCFYPKTPLVLEQMSCTMAMAYAMGLPGTLAGCAAALGVEQQKDMEGSRLMLQMCKPRDISADGKTITWWDEDEKMDRLIKYCVQDVEVERAITKRMLKLTPYEKRVWVLDQKINGRGVTIDRKAVENAVELVEKEKDRLDEKMRKVSANQIATCTAVQQIKDYLQFYGVSEGSLGKADVTSLLENPKTHPHAREILELRSQGGKAATAKLSPMLNGIGEDNQLRGCFQYSGANTRRWAGRRVQLHNLARGKLKHEDVSKALGWLSSDDVDTARDKIDLVYGPPLEVLSSCVRGFITASPGHELITCDFSAIEARVLAWLAGQEDVLNVFRRNEDIYLVQASSIFRDRITDKNDPRRQIGKVAILALGYQGGVGAFHTMAKGYNVKMEPAFDELWAAASFDQKSSALSRHESAGKKYEISEKEFLASEITKIMWREVNYKIVKYWADIEGAFIQAVNNPGQTITVNANIGRPVKFKKSGSFLGCQLPSGGVIFYPYPEIKETKTPWDTMKMLPSYMSEDGQSKKWQRFSTYGGSIVENITQATARDLLADAMLRLEEKNYRVVAHIHDEIVCNMNIGKGSLEEMEKIMSVVPPWAFGLPLAASGWVGKRYRK